MTGETNEYGLAVKRPSNANNKCVGCVYYRGFKQMRICFNVISIVDILHGESVSDYAVNGFGCDSREAAENFTPEGLAAVDKVIKVFVAEMGGEIDA